MDAQQITPNDFLNELVLQRKTNSRMKLVVRAKFAFKLKVLIECR